MKLITKVFLLLIFTFNFWALAQQNIASKDGILLSPDKRLDIKETTQAIARWTAEGKSPEEILEMLNAIIPGIGTGAISGNVFQADGQTPLPVTAYINVYDEYGFYSGSAYINAGSSNYTVTNLAAGQYYIQVDPYGNYLPEFYEGATDWRQATLVYTENDSIVTGINFQLKMGKVISGKVLEDYTFDPLGGYYAEFLLFSTDAVTNDDYYQYFYQTITQDGLYILDGIASGNYKLRIFINGPGLAAEFYNDKQDLSTADIIQVPAAADSVKFINFILSPPVAVQDGYEPNGRYEEAFELSIGDNITGQINPALDVDFFTFNGNQFDTLDIDLQARSIGSVLYPNMELYDSSASRIGGIMSPDINWQDFILPYTGRYYIRIIHSSPFEGGEDYFYDLSLDYSAQLTLPRGSLAGEILMDDELTPYNGSGYQILLLDNLTQSGSWYSFDEATFIINEIPIGTYNVAISPSDTGYTMQWFEDVFTLEEASVVTVTETDTADINFVLHPAGSISGRLFMDNLLTDWDGGGYLYLFKDGDLSGMPAISLPVAPDQRGLFNVAGIIAGEYRMLFNPINNNLYPPVWFGDVATQGQATPITVTAGQITDNVTFILKRGGLIKGFVTHSDWDQTPVSSDSLRITIIPYGPQGFMQNYYAQNSFAGGFRTNLLYPGMYKLQALSQSSTLASWYYDTGSHFNDTGSQLIEVLSDSVHEISVTLSEANGCISGIVYKPDGVAATNKGGIIYAYDMTGHMVQSAIIGLDPETGQLIDNGHYRICGLKSGDYYLMLSFNSMMNNPRDRLVNIENSTTEFKKSALDIRNSIVEQWFPNIIIKNNYPFPPFFKQIPQGATLVNVTDPGETAGTDFYDIIISIDEQKESILPAVFELSAIYPNPFNPSATIAYSVPQSAMLKIEIFDILGRRVSTLLNEVVPAGHHKVQWNGKNQFEQLLSSGIYIARLQAGARVSSMKMILLR